MNLFTGRQARPQASINSLKWLWLVCWGKQQKTLSPQRQELFIWQTLYSPVCSLSLIMLMVVCTMSSFAQDISISAYKDSFSPTIRAIVPVSGSVSIVLTGKRNSTCDYKAGSMNLSFATKVKTTTNTPESYSVDLGGDLGIKTGDKTNLLSFFVGDPNFNASLKGSISGFATTTTEITSETPAIYLYNYSDFKDGSSYDIFDQLESDSFRFAINVKDSSGKIISTTGWQPIESDCTKCAFPDLTEVRDSSQALFNAVQNLCKPTTQIIVGDSGLFKQDNNISRAEFLKMVLAVQGTSQGTLESTNPCNDGGVPPFEDVSSVQWYCPVVDYAKERKYVHGDAKIGEEFGKKFRPNMGILRGESFKMIYNILIPNSIQSNTSTSNHEPWYQEFIDKLDKETKCLEKVFKTTDAYFPIVELTRGHAALLLDCVRTYRTTKGL